MKKILLLLFTLLPICLLADNVSQQKALSIAEHFFASSGAQTTRSTSLQMVWDGESSVSRSSYNAPAFYVFNRDGEPGFVIVSGDNRTVNPILAYSYEHHFSAENMPDNLRTWME